jgi:hypothetical protein
MPGAVPGGGLHGDDNLNMFINQLIQLSSQGFMNDDVLRRVGALPGRGTPRA